jgi:hypothetical protein
LTPKNNPNIKDEVKLLLDENDVHQFQYLQNHFNLADRGELVRYAITYLYGKVKGQQQQNPYPVPPINPTYIPWAPYVQPEPTYSTPPQSLSAMMESFKNMIPGLLKSLTPKCWCGQDLTTPHPHNNL